MSSKRIGAIACLFFLFAVVSPSASACPNCKEAIAAQPTTDAASTAQGYNWSVLFMIAVPFSLLGTGTFLVKRAADRGLFPEL